MPETAFVTGGSGAVGSAIVRRLSSQGRKVAFTWMRNREAAEELADATGAIPFQTDLTQRDQADKAVESALEAFGRIDLLVNNAGRTQVMPFALIEEQDWDEIISANLKPLFLVTHAAVRSMIARKSGCIINIGSLAGQRMLEVPVHYATAKSAVTGFTLSLARELSRYGIRVNEVVPGLLSQGVGRMVPEKEMADYIAHCATGRPGEPEEVAATVAFLAGKDAAYINAQSIFVDGGI